MSNVVMTSGELEPLSVTIQETQRLTGESRSAVYNHIARGDYEAVKSGARVLIIYESIKRRLATLPHAVIKPPRKRSTRKRQR